MCTPAARNDAAVAGNRRFYGALREPGHIAKARAHLGFGAEDDLSVDKVKKSFRKMAMRYHHKPGGNAEMMRMVVAARKVLEDHLAEESGAAESLTRSTWRDFMRTQQRAGTGKHREPFWRAMLRKCGWDMRPPNAACG